MIPSVRLHFDEHVSSAIAQALRRRGIDVTTAAEANLLGADDELHLAFALQSGRVTFTQDADFLRIHASGIHHAGIIYCRQGSRRIGEVIHRLIVICRQMSPEQLVGQAIFL